MKGLKGVTILPKKKNNYVEKNYKMIPTLLVVAQ